MSVSKKMQHKKNKRVTELDGNKKKTEKVKEQETLRHEGPVGGEEKLQGEEKPQGDVSSESSAGGSAVSAGDEKQESGRAAESPELKRVEELEEQLRQLQGENSELKDQYLRKQADFENFRKRMQREKQDALKYANTNLLQDLITIIDNFERAIKSSEESRDFESFHSGIKMIEHQFIGMLERKYGLKRMESEGQEFDPQMHEAINMEESPDVDAQVVVEDYQKGYLLHDRVLRHARVKVAVPAPSNGSGGASDGEPTGASGEQIGGESPDEGNAQEAEAKK
jgi:molecular chaperone GrpE